MGVAYVLRLHLKVALRGREVVVVPQASFVTAFGTAPEEPGAIDGDCPHLLPELVAELDEPDGNIAQVRVLANGFFKGVQIRSHVVVDGENERVPVDVRSAEHEAGRGHVDASRSEVVVDRLLVGEWVDDGAGNLDKLAGGDRMQVICLDGEVKCLVPTLDVEVDALGVVQGALKREKVVHPLAVELEDNVSGLQASAVRGARGDDLVRHQEARGVAVLVADRGLLLLVQAEAHALGEGEVLEDALQGATWHGLAVAHVLERSDDAVQRQVEARGRARLAAGVEGHTVAVLVDHRAAAGAARGAARGGDVERVVVVVLLAAVVGRVAVEAREGASQDGELLARVVADHADLEADLGALRRERDLREVGQEVDLGRVEAEEAKVVHGVAVQRHHGHLLLAEEGGVRLDGAGRHHVAVGENDAALAVHHEARGAGAAAALAVERAHVAHVQHHHRARDALDRLREPRPGL
mmetsp:Transcript_16254/g.46126  ORF Transcript_16254/g.46126 Transcript_16254/m.46126 type:complete len:468 (+) Transcript_16254:1789-3192(+)